MATEEQTTRNNSTPIGLTSNVTRAGQKLTITNRYVSKLGFWLSKQNDSTVGEISFKIFNLSDTVLASKVLGDASILTTSLVFNEVTFDVPVFISEEVRIACVKEDKHPTNYIRIAYNGGGSVKASEEYTQYISSWVETSANDMAYIYTYSGGETGSPTVTIQATSGITGTTATGNGNVTALGSPLATQHGHCWALHPDPTTDEPLTHTITGGRTELGVPSATGAYTSSLTTLSQNASYYMRSYIISSLGTFYSDQQAFFTTTTGLPLVNTDPFTDITVTTAQGRGRINNNGGSPIIQHGMVWDKSDQVDPEYESDTGSGEWNQIKAGPRTLIGTFWATITFLTANTEYKARAYALNDTGVGYGAVLTFTTNAIGIPIISTQPLTNVQSTSATAHGTLVNESGSTVTEHGFVYKEITDPHTSPKTSDTKNATSASILPGDTFSASITRLTAGTGYVLAAYGINATGTGYGNDVFIRRGTEADPSTVIAAELKGNYTVLGKHWAYTDDAGDQRALLGTIIKK